MDRFGPEPSFPGMFRMGGFGLEPVDGKGPVISFANGVWVEQSLGLNPAYQEIVKNVYKAEAKSVYFQNKVDQVIKEVNSWVAKSTNGVIENLLPPYLSSDTRLILANALYFKGDWSMPFDKSKTREKEFYLLNGETALVPYVSEAWKSYFYSFHEDYKLLRLQYKNGQDNTRKFSMYIFLPNERNGLNNLIQKYFTTDPGFVHQKFQLGSVKLRTLRIPKFKFSYNFSPANVMMELGLTLPFCNEGELDGIVNSPRSDLVQISNVIQKSSIEVNEEGTEAASAFGMMASGCSPFRETLPPRDFIADHPFVFMIREDNSLELCSIHYFQRTIFFSHFLSMLIFFLLVFIANLEIYIYIAYI